MEFEGTTAQIVIVIGCEDGTDADWLKSRLEGAVDDVIQTQKEEGRLDGWVDVSVDLEYA